MAEVSSEHYGGSMGLGPEFAQGMSAQFEYPEGREDSLAAEASGQATGPFGYINHQAAWVKDMPTRAPVLDGRDTSFLNHFFSDKNPGLPPSHPSNANNPGMPHGPDFNVQIQEISDGNYTFIRSSDGFHPVTTAQDQNWSGMPTSGDFNGLSQLANVPGVDYHPAGKDHNGLVEGAAQALYNLKTFNSDLQGVPTSGHGMFAGMNATHPTTSAMDGSYNAPPHTQYEQLAAGALDLISVQDTGHQYQGLQLQAPGSFHGPSGRGRMQSVDGSITDSTSFHDSAAQHGLSATQPSQRMPFFRFNSDPNVSGGAYGYQAADFAPTMQQTKSHNLMHVPFADRAAVRGQVSTQPRHMAQEGQHIFHMGNGMYDPHSLGNGGLPIFNSSTIAIPDRAMQWGAVIDHDVQSSQNMQGEEAPRPLKRRRSNNSQGDDGDDEYLPESSRARDTKVRRDTGNSNSSGANSKAKRRKPSPKAKNSNASTSPNNAQTLNGEGAPSKRRGSNGRTNLSAEQKRQNHIASEQKRRNTIKDAHKELDQLVPTLKNGRSGMSKAEQIREIAAFVKSIKEGNKAVRVELDRRDMKLTPGPPKYDDDNDESGRPAANGYGQGGFAGYGNFQQFNHLR